MAQLDISITIDRSMGLVQTLTVARRSTARELKQLLADGDPTGSTRADEIVLALPAAAPGQRPAPLSDFTELTKRHSALDLLTAADFEAWAREDAEAAAVADEEEEPEAPAAPEPTPGAPSEADAAQQQWHGSAGSTSQTLAPAPLRGHQGRRPLAWPSAEPAADDAAADVSDGGALSAAPLEAEESEALAPAEPPAGVDEAAPLAIAVREQVVAGEDGICWAPPPADARGFRLGEYLWCGAARLQEAPAGGFLPRRSFAAVTLPPSGRLAASLLLLGGRREDEAMNDVWRLSLPRLGAQRGADASGAAARPKWTEVSPQDVGQANGFGQRVMRKWKGRSNFGCCAATSGKGGALVYVAAGCDGGRNFLNDVWASEDGGAKWVCMSREAPWQKRTAPGVCALPGRPDHILLAGGIMKSGELFQDVWLSDDAGSTWVMLERPECLEVTGRYRSALLPLAPREHDERCTARVLLLGGCFIDGGDRGYACLERLMHDAWECHLDFSTPDRSKAATWTCWGNIKEGRGSSWEPVGVDSFTCALDASSHTLVARLPSQDFLCVAKARAPPETYEAVPWHPVRPSRPSRVLVREKPDGLPKAETERLVFVRLSASVPALVPRLVVVTTREVFLSDDGEWRRQVLFMLLLGLRIGTSSGFPAELWTRRVMPAVLPSVLTPLGRKPAAVRA